MSRLQDWLASIPELSSSASPQATSTAGSSSRISSSSSRVQSLCSDIARQKSANPAAYNANVSWWRRTLASLLESGAQSDGDHAVLSVDDELVEGIARSAGRRPMALTSVVEEMCAAHELVRLDDFLNSTHAITDSGGLPLQLASILTKPLWWAMEQLGLSSDDSSSSVSYEQRWKIARGSYVHLPAVEKAAEIVATRQRDVLGTQLSNSVYDLVSFRAQFGHLVFPSSAQPATDLDIKVLLRYLDRDRKVVVFKDEVIKFTAVGEAREVTELDRNVLELTAAERVLSKQVDELSSSIEERTAKAKEYVTMKRNEMAKSFLRSRASLQDVLKKRLQSLETIQTVLLKIETAAGDVQIMKAYETSSKALEGLLSHPSLQRDNVDQTMSRLADTLADHAEIEQAIAIGGVQGADMDDDELEAELQALVVKEKEDTLPSVPKGEVKIPEKPLAALDAEAGGAEEITVQERESVSM